MDRRSPNRLQKQLPTFVNRAAADCKIVIASTKVGKNQTNHLIVFHLMSKSYKYRKIWCEHLPSILKLIHQATHSDSGKIHSLQLNRLEFEEVGDRNNSGYAFRMDIPNGAVPKKPGSSVARDLKYVLDKSTEFIEMAENKYITIRMGKDFLLEVSSASY